MEKISVASVYRSVAGLLSKRPGILLPFCVVSGLEIFALLTVYLIPQTSLSALLGPPIRSFYGEIYLHYPMDLLLLPKLFQHVQTAVALFVGSWMSASVVAFISAESQAGSAGLKWYSYSKSVLSRYPAIFVVSLLSFLLAKYSMTGTQIVFRWAVNHFPNVMGHLSLRWWSLVILAISLGIALTVEILFAYVIPALIIEKKSLWKAFGRSLAVLKRNFLVTLVLVGVPVFLYFVSVLIRGAIPGLIERTFPEISLGILFASILVSFLINSAIMTSVTILFLYQRQREQAAGNLPAKEGAHAATA